MRSNFLESVKKYQYISFDVFDTLLIRKNAKPEVVFFNVEERLKEEGILTGNFAKERIAAQEKANKSEKAESTFDDIYDFVDIQGLDKELCKRIEIEEEEKELIPNDYLKTVIQRLEKQGKKIVITSDMYHSADTISHLLRKKGFEFDYIFVSSEYQARKSRGNLFDCVIKNLGIKKSQLIHIGDNRRSDYLIPIVKGIKAIQWKQGFMLNEHTKKYLKHGDEGKELYKFLSTHSTKADSYYGIGYELFGPVLMGFCNWIHSENEKENIDQLCFLARDGQIIRKAYTLLYPGDYSYLLASRRSLTVPQLTTATCFDDIIKTVPYIKREETIRDLLYKVGVEDKGLIAESEKKYGTEISRAELTTEKGDKLFNEIKSQMKDNSASEMEACRKYITQELNGKKIGLVDIGWYGTMQSSINCVCDLNEDKKEFTGLYFGFLEKAGVNESLKAKGYVYDFNRKGSTYSPNLIYGFNGLIELMFTADHGSAKKYVIDDTGDAQCVLEDNKGEYSDFVKSVQEGALQFISDWRDDKREAVSDYCVLFSALNDLLEKPTIYDCKELGELQFFDAYFEKLIQYPGLIKAILSPKKTMKSFLKSNWKIGYIKKAIPIVKPTTVYKILNKMK